MALLNIFAMSKAFTREDDDIPERPVLPRSAPALPPGAKNFLTPDGERRLRAELERLTRMESSEVADAAGADRSDGAQRLGAADRQRRLQIQQGLAMAVVVAPPPRPWEQVRFGATVTVRADGGAETRYRIVGVDETDVDRDWVSWVSPIARALLNARMGQRVRLKFPGGEQGVEIAGIVYE